MLVRANTVHFLTLDVRDIDNGAAPKIRLAL